jgi:hypothetical protein
MLRGRRLLRKQPGPRSGYQAGRPSYASWHTWAVSEPSDVSGVNLAALSDHERSEAMHSESLWRRAHEIVTRYPNLDAGDVYHALRALELAPSERLRRGLSRGRLRAHAR